MPAVPASFEVCGWAVGPSRRELIVSYRLEHPTLGLHDLHERIDLPVEVPSEPGSSFSHAATLLAVAAGVSYFKAVAPERVTFGAGIALDPAGTAAMAALYDEGLREFVHANHLPLPRPVALPPAGLAPAPVVRPAAGRPLVPIGAGRDSSLLASILAEVAGAHPLLLAVGDNPYAPRVAAATGLELVVARRTIDVQLLSLNAAGAMNGHVPVTAINSLVAVLVACATGCTSVLMANERSASQPTRIVGGVEINHQYSKSFAFEMLLREALRPTGVEYYSALRPWGELPVAAAFAQRDARLHAAFMSCNRAFVRDPAKRSDGWCGNCPKCRSVYLSLAPFMSPIALTGIFGRDLLADESQRDGFLALVDPGAKPFECVGEIDEARTAVALLATDDAWRDHAVVRALAATSPAPITADGFERSDEHAVPDVLLEHLARIIDASPEVRARTAAALAAGVLRGAEASST
jgi:hypothetical protein